MACLCVVPGKVRVRGGGGAEQSVVGVYNSGMKVVWCRGVRGGILCLHTNYMVVWLCSCGDGGGDGVGMGVLCWAVVAVVFLLVSTTASGLPACRTVADPDIVSCSEFCHKRF